MFEKCVFNWNCITIGVMLTYSGFKKQADMTKILYFLHKYLPLMTYECYHIHIQYIG